MNRTASQYAALRADLARFRRSLDAQAAALAGEGARLVIAVDAIEAELAAFPRRIP